MDENGNPTNNLDPAVIPLLMNEIGSNATKGKMITLQKDCVVQSLKHNTFCSIRCFKRSSGIKIH